MPQKKLLYPLFNLHLKRFSWSSSVTLQKHENKCSQHNVISIPMFLMYKSLPFLLSGLFLLYHPAKQDKSATKAIFQGFF